MREVTFKDFKRLQLAIARALGESQRCEAKALRKRAQLLAGVEASMPDAEIELELAGVIARGHAELAAITSALETAAVAFLGERRQPGECPADYLVRICAVIAGAAEGGLAIMFDMQARNGLRYNPAA